MEHLKALTQELTEQGYNATYLGKLPPNHYAIQITKPGHYIRIYARGIDPHIIKIGLKPIDLTDPESTHKLLKLLTEPEQWTRKAN